MTLDPDNPYAGTSYERKIQTLAQQHHNDFNNLLTELIQTQADLNIPRSDDGGIDQVFGELVGMATISVLSRVNNRALLQVCPQRLCRIALTAIVSCAHSDFERRSRN